MKSFCKLDELVQVSSCYNIHLLQYQLDTVT